MFIANEYNSSRKKSDIISVPIGTKRHMSQYRSKKYGKPYIPPEDIVYLRSSAKDQFSLLGIMKTGYGKTRLMKRILPYLVNEFNWRAMIFDCKGFEMYHGKFKTDDYRGLLPWEVAKAGLIGPLPLRCYMPSFVREKAKRRRLFDMPENKYLNDFDTFSYHIEDIENVIEAATLGVSPSARMVLLDKVKTKIESGEISSTEEIIAWVKSARINYSVKDNLINVFSFLSKEKFFDTDEMKINVAKDWKHGLVPNISLLEPPPEMASYYVGKIINDVYSRDTSRKNKLVIIDDASKVLGARMNSKEHLSVQQIEDILTLGRYRRFHCIVLSQSYKLLNDTMFPHFKYKIFSKLGSADLNLIQNFCSGDIIWKIKHLRYVPEKQIKEMILVNPDNMTSSTFFPLAPLAKHL